MPFNNSWNEEMFNEIQTDKLEEKIKDKLNTPIFPLNLLTTIKNTNNGLMGNNAIRNRFYQWEAIITGNESIFVNWQNSTKYTQVNIDATKPQDKPHWKVEYQKGDMFMGSFYDEQGETTFGESDFGSFGKFTNISDNVNFKFKSLFKIDLEALTKLYLIPDRVNNYQGFQDNNIYYISNFQNYRNESGDFVYSDIEFTNIKQELSQSGQAIQQKIYFSSPGQGYAFPRNIYDETGKFIDYELHPEYIKDLGVNTIQLEITGNAAIVGIEIFGSPIENLNESNNNIYPNRKLLIDNLKLPIQEDFQIVSNANNSYYYTDIDLQVTADYDNYAQRRKELVGDKQMNYQGLIQMNHDTTIETNPQNLTINDLNLMVTDSFLKRIGNNGILNVAPNYYFYDGIQNDNTIGYGKKEIDIKKIPGNRMTFKDILNLMSFTFQHINQLPFSTNTKLTWSLKDIPIIGGLLNKITFGFPYFWRQITSNSNLLYPNLQIFPALISKPVYDFFTGTTFASNIQKDNIKKIPLDVFQTEESSTLGAIFGSESTTTSLAFDLTDKCNIDYYTKSKNITSVNRPSSTLMINQLVSIPQHSNELMKGKISERFYSMNKFTEIEDKFTDIQGTGNYIINGIGIRMIGDGDIRITMYKDNIDFLPEGTDIRNSIIYQSIIKSQAGYRNSQIREWLTFQKMNFIDSLTTWENDFTWPIANPYPKPEITLPSFDFDSPPDRNIRNISTTPVNQNQTAYRLEYHNQLFNLYDFSQKGMISLKQIKDSYSTIIIPEDMIRLALNQILSIINIDGGFLEKIETKQNIFSNKTYSINIKNLNNNEGAPTEDNNNQLWNINEEYSVNNINIIYSGLKFSFDIFNNSYIKVYFFFEGTLLRMRIRIKYEIDVKLENNSGGYKYTTLRYGQTNSWLNRKKINIIPIDKSKDIQINIDTNDIKLIEKK